MRRLLVWITVFLSVGQPGAQAQYPVKPVRVVVAFPPGGASDYSARTVTKHVFGDGVVIDNRPGAHGVTAVQTVWQARGDGYTLLWGIGSMVALPMLWSDFPVRSMAEFVPVSMAAQLMYGMFAAPGLPVKSPQEFAQYAKGRETFYASAALSEQLAAVRFMKAAGINLTRVGYKGGVQVLPDLASGRVAVQFAPAAPVAPLAREGRIRVLAFMEPERLSAFPDVPTMTEAGFASVMVAGWQALFAPPGVAPAIIKQLERRVAAAVSQKSLQTQLEQGLIRVRHETAAQLGATVRVDVKMWQAFIHEYNIKAE